MNDSSLQNQLAIYRDNLASLLERAALAGGLLFAPLETQNQIRLTRAQIADLKRKLRGLGAEVADQPDDGDAVPQDAPDARRERLLRALLHDHSGFVQDRLDSFVGRAAELAEVQRRVAGLLPSGGYVTITGQAGQGKSSLIARLLELHLRQTLAAAGSAATGRPATAAELLAAAGDQAPVFHFIPFQPGPDHQVGLLRNLMARLLLKHGLPELYVASDSRAALRDYFARVLEQVARQGRREVIFIDGLDQIEEDASGARDLSFLPTRPPAGIVFVLGTRPNDTLQPLELRTPHQQYALPALSRADFDLVLQHRGVALDPPLADRFYAAMAASALYLDLVARELAEAAALPPEQIIARVADNPSSLFSLAIERLRRPERAWRETLKPILGLLLAAQAPLRPAGLRALLGQDHDSVQEGLLRLGGLLARDGQGRCTLFHLKLRDFLREDPQQPQRRALFSAEDEQGYHQCLAEWCERGGLEQIWQARCPDASEQERRAYARQHYVAHLCRGGLWERLWALLDAGAYGQAKLRHDPSTHGFVLDLDTVRQALVAATGADTETGLAWLPRLWRYSLLRCSLSSQVDSYPEGLIELLAQLGRADEAVGLAELLTEPQRKATTLARLGLVLEQRQQPEQAQQLFVRALAVAHTIENLPGRVTTLEGMADILNNTGHTEEAARLEEVINALLKQHLKLPSRTPTARRQNPYSPPDRSRWWSSHPSFPDSIAPHTTANTAPDTHILQDRAALEAFFSLDDALDQTPTAEEPQTTPFPIPKTDILNQSSQILHRSTNNSTASQRLENRLQDILQKQGIEATHICADKQVQAPERAYALCFVAEAYAKAQRWEQAASIARQAALAAAAIDEADERLPVLIAVMGYLLKAEQRQAAIALAHTIAALATGEASWLRGRAAFDQLLELLAAGYADVAIGVAKTLTDPEEQAEALLRVAKTLAENDRHAEATLVAREAIAVVQRIAHPLSRKFALNDVFEALVGSECWEAALECADAVAEPQERVELLLIVAEGLAKAERRDTLVELARSITAAIGTLESARDREQILQRLLPPLAEAQADAEILAALRTLPEPDDQAALLHHLVEELAEEEHWDAAARLAQVLASCVQQLEDSWHQRYALEKSIKLLAAKRTHGAVELAHQISGLDGRVEALVVIVQALIADQQVDEAFTIARNAVALACTIDTSTQQIRLLNEIVAHLARTQRCSETIAIINSISNPHHKTISLCVAAAVFVEIARPEQAEPLAQEAVMLARRITDEAQQAQALVALAYAFIKEQHQEQARSLAQQASALTHTIEDPGTRAEICCDIAKLFLELQCLDEAAFLALDAASMVPIAAKFEKEIDFIDRLINILLKLRLFRVIHDISPFINDEFQKDSIIFDFTIYVSESQLLEESITIARSITNGARRSLLLLGLATKLIESEQWSLSSLLIREAGSAFRAATDIVFQQMTFSVIKDGFTQIHTIINHYRQLEESSEEPDESEEVVQAIEAFLADIQYWAAHLTSPEALAQAQAQDGGIEALVELLIEQQRFAEAANVAEEFGAPWHQARWLSTISQALIEAQRFEEASALARAVKDPQTRAQALVATTTGLVQAQHIEAAQTLAGSIAEPLVQVQLLCTIASAVFQAHDAQQFSATMRAAQVLTQSMAEPDERTQALCHLAGIFLYAQQTEQANTALQEALAAASLIAQPDKQAATLRTLAETLITAQHWEQARAVAQAAAAAAGRIDDRMSSTLALSSIEQVLRQAEQAEQAPTPSAGVLPRRELGMLMPPQRPLRRAAQTGAPPITLSALQQQWSQATRRADLLALLPAAAPLFSAHPGLLDEVLAGSAWVQEQLKW